MEKVVFTGYEPGAVMGQKMKLLVDEIVALREEVEKLKAAEVPAKKSPTKAKTEE